MQVLELQFLKDDGKMLTFAIDNPITPVNEANVAAIMDTILASGVFRTLGPNARKKGARLVNRSITEIGIAK
ncbi:DUF2922 domain-containing protein [Microbacteriaceae bacterium 4G12]